MTRFSGLVFLVGALALWTAPAEAQTGNSIEIVIGSGRHAGTYKLPVESTICLHVAEQQQFSAAYSDRGIRDPKIISSAGINVFDPDDAARQHGAIIVIFGDRNSKPPIEYVVSIPARSPESLTMTRKGSVVELAFRGVTKAGIAVRGSATCRNIDEF